MRQRTHIFVGAVILFSGLLGSSGALDPNSVVSQIPPQVRFNVWADGQHSERLAVVGVPTKGTENGILVDIIPRTNEFASTTAEVLISTSSAGVHVVGIGHAGVNFGFEINGPTPSPIRLVITWNKTIFDWATAARGRCDATIRAEIENVSLGVVQAIIATKGDYFSVGDEFFARAATSIPPGRITTIAFRIVDCDWFGLSSEYLPTGVEAIEVRFKGWHCTFDRIPLAVGLSTFPKWVGFERGGLTIDLLGGAGGVCEGEVEKLGRTIPIHAVMSDIEKVDIFWRDTPQWILIGAKSLPSGFARLDVFEELALEVRPLASGDLQFINSFAWDNVVAPGECKSAFFAAAYECHIV